MPRYMLPGRAERFLNTLLGRLFAEPTKKSGVTLGDLMPTGLRSEVLEEVLKERSVGCALLATLFAPRGRGRLPDGITVAKLLNSLFKKPGQQRILAVAIAQQKRVEQKVGATSFFLRTKTPVLPLHTGPLGLPTFPLHPLWGIPFVPARLIKGALRGYLISRDEEEDAALLCGTADRKGEAIFFDAYPAGEDDLEVGCELFCAHNCLYYEGGAVTDWHEPRVLLYGAIPAGVRFRFSVAGPEKVVGLVKEALCRYGVGARRALGYGRFAEEE